MRTASKTDNAEKNMLTCSSFGWDEIETGLRSAVELRALSGEYSDAVRAAFRYMTEVIRSKSGEAGDGLQLVGKALGGNAPAIRVNQMRTQSEVDEQKGVETLIRGLYTAIRNPLNHENVQTSEVDFLRALMMVDTAIRYLTRQVVVFEMNDFVTRVFDPYFVASKDYADQIVSSVPQDQLAEAFTAIFNKRNEGDANKLKFTFRAFYGRMSESQISTIISLMAQPLRNETDLPTLVRLLKILRGDFLRQLPDDVRTRLENMMLDDMAKGTYDAYSGPKLGPIGTWVVRFGEHFTDKQRLLEVLNERLRNDWYSQNYMGHYFMYILPDLVPSQTDAVSTVCDSLSYAMIVNQAKILRQKFTEVCKNYPPLWKEQLRAAIQLRNDSDPDFVARTLALLD